MTLSPEQFNQLASKKDMENIERIVNDMADNMHSVMNVLDGVAQDIKDIKTENAANIGMHRKFDKRLTDIETELDLQPVLES